VTPEGQHVELLQGTLDLIVLRALSTMGPLRAYALATRSRRSQTPGVKVCRASIGERPAPTSNASSS
jgi:hypothetical protein